MPVPIKPEDLALLFFALVALIVNAIPSIAQLVPPQYSVILLAAGALLKSILEYVKQPPQAPPQ